MSHPRWPGFDTKTGNPVADNKTRNLNRRIWREAQARLTFRTPGGRRRKKALTRIEGGNYIKAVVAVMNHFARKDSSA